MIQLFASCLATNFTT